MTTNERFGSTGDAAAALVLDNPERDALRLVIDRAFARDEIPDARRYLEAGARVGKTVVTLPA